MVLINSFVLYNTNELKEGNKRKGKRGNVKRHEIYYLTDIVNETCKFNFRGII